MARLVTLALQKILNVKRTATMLVLVLSISGLVAQDPIDVAMPIDNPIGLHLVHFYDPISQLGFDEIRDKEFVPCEDQILNFGYNTGADWLKFTLTNSGEKQLDRILRINKPILDTLELYYWQEGALQKEMTGALVIKDQQFRHTTSNYFSISIPPDDTISYYLKVVGMHSKQLAIFITTDYEYAEYEQNSTLVVGFYLGALIIITVYSLFLGIGIRDPLYFWYVLSNFGSLVATLTLKGFFTAYIFNNQPEISLLFVPINIASFGVLSSFFCVRMISIKEYSKLAYYTFYAVVVFSVIAVLYPYISHKMGYPATFSWLSYSTMFFTLTAIASGLIAVRRGDEIAMFYLFAWLVGWIGVILYVMVLLGVLPINFLTENLYLVGSVIEVSALSFALAKRYNHVLIDRDQLERDLKFRESDLSMVISDNKMRYQFKNALLQDLEELKTASGEELKKNVNSLTHNLRAQVEKERKFNFFEDQLDNINAEFEARLKERFPDLTQSEIEICFLIRLNLSNKDIAHFRNTSEGAIKTVRYRIRKKIGQDVGDLNEMIKNI